MSVKKMSLLPLFAVGALLFSGCSSFVIVKTSTLSTLDVGYEVQPWPVTADLKVVEQQRTNGEASGLAANKDRLIEEALAKALWQDPPTVDGPDALVAMSVFTEQTGQNMRVVVTGYPAYYVNFRNAEPADPSCPAVLAPGLPPPGVSVKKPRFGLLPFLK